MQKLYVPIGIAVACAVAVAALVVSSNRTTFITTAPSATTTTTTPEIVTSGDATVSMKPDLAVIGAGIQAQASTASAAQADLGAKAAQLIARIKAIGVADGDLNTTGYWIGPIYGPQGQLVTSFQASEQLHLKWHNVDSVGKALDAIVQEGGATNIYVSFTLNDPKPAQAQARSLAIADAKAKASAMASAAGVRVGQVLQINDIGSSTRVPYPYAAMGASAAPTQVPVGQIDVQVSVEVDFAIA